MDSNNIGPIVGITLASTVVGVLLLYGVYHACLSFSRLDHEGNEIQTAGKIELGKQSTHDDSTVNEEAMDSEEELRDLHQKTFGLQVPNVKESQRGGRRTHLGTEDDPTVVAKPIIKKEQDMIDQLSKVAKSRRGGRTGIDDDPELVAKTIKRAKDNFPTLMAKAAERSRTFESIDSLKDYLLNEIHMNLDNLLEEERLRLMKRENAEELFLTVGIDERVAKYKVAATKDFEREMGIVGKLPTLEMVYTLIGNLDLDNPFGAVTAAGLKVDNLTDAPTGDEIEENYKGEPRLHYLGVELKKDSLFEAVDKVIRILEQKNLDGCYQHGTCAAVLKKIFKSKRLIPDESGHFTDPWGKRHRHDFGSGVYCFLGELVHALSFAFDRSWPRVVKEEVEDGEDIYTVVPQDNPAVILFRKPNEHVLRMHMLDVSSKHPFEVDPLLELGLWKSLEEFQEKEKEWNSEHLNWKAHVILARFYNMVASGPHQVLFGWLHECSTTSETDSGQEPIPDKDGWIQYCFQKSRLLGDDNLFIEFHLDWKTWFDGENLPTRQNTDQLKAAADKVITTVGKEHDAFKRWEGGRRF